jgi:cyclophilin family peptidyl-prolyl cis-trans isomerase
MTTLLAGLLVLGGQAVTGPKVLVTLGNGKSFTLQLDAKNTPATTKGITALVKKGFYNGIRVHRVEDWVVQWGDPLSRNGVDSPGVGSGGTGKNLPFEAGKLSFTKGTLGMASTGTGVGGDCQIFVVTRDSTFLNGGYSAFGKVVKGMDVVLHIQKGDKIASMKVVK